MRDKTRKKFNASNQQEQDLLNGIKVSKPVISFTAFTVLSGVSPPEYNALIFCEALALLWFVPVKVSLGIDNIAACCVLGSYEHTIIVSDIPVLSPKTKISNLSKFFKVSLFSTISGKGRAFYAIIHSFGKKYHFI